LRFPESTLADHEVAGLDRRSIASGQRAGVADARRAPVAHGVEAEGVEVLGESPALL